MARQIVLLFILIILSHANAQEIPYKFSKDIIAEIDKKQSAFAFQCAATDLLLKEIISF